MRGPSLNLNLSKTIAPFPELHKGWINHIAFSPDGRTLATCAADDRLILWDFAERRPKRQSNARHYQMFYLHVIKKQSVLQVAKSLGVSAAQVYLVKHRIGRRIKREIKHLQTKLM